MSELDNNHDAISAEEAQRAADAAAVTDWAVDIEGPVSAEDQQAALKSLEESRKLAIEQNQPAEQERLLKERQEERDENMGTSE
jgi:hypothetical protein